jgi:hypothetical protein
VVLLSVYRKLVLESEAFLALLTLAAKARVGTNLMFDDFRMPEVCIAAIRALNWAMLVDFVSLKIHGRREIKIAFLTVVDFRAHSLFTRNLLTSMVISVMMNQGFLCWMMDMTLCTRVVAVVVISMFFESRLTTTYLITVLEVAW